MRLIDWSLYCKINLVHPFCIKIKKKSFLKCLYQARIRISSSRMHFKSCFIPRTIIRRKSIKIYNKLAKYILPKFHYTLTLCKRRFVAQFHWFDLDEHATIVGLSISICFYCTLCLTNIKSEKKKRYTRTVYSLLFRFFLFTLGWTWVCKISLIVNKQTMVRVWYITHIGNFTFQRLNVKGGWSIQRFDFYLWMCKSHTQHHLQEEDRPKIVNKIVPLIGYLTVKSYKISWTNTNNRTHAHWSW